MQNSRILPTWPPSAIKAGNRQRRSTSATKASLARVAGRPVAAVHPSRGSRRGADFVVLGNELSFLSTPIFSGDVSDDHSCIISEEGTLDRSCSSLISTAPSTTPSDHHEDLMNAPSRTENDGRKTGTLSPTAEPTVSVADHRNYSGKCEYGCMQHEPKKCSNLSAKRRDVVFRDARACCLQGMPSVCTVRTAPNVAMERAETLRAHVSRQIERTGPTTVVVRQAGSRLPQGKNASSSNGAAQVNTNSAPLKSQARSSSAVEQVPRSAAQSPCSSLESEVVRDVFGGGDFVTQRNGMHTAWRRANLALQTTAADSLQPPPVEEGVVAASPTTADRHVVDENKNPIPVEKEQQLRRVCLRRHFIPPSSADKNTPITSNDGARGPPESRLFLRRHRGLSARPTRENVRSAANVPSSVRGVDSSSYNSSGGAARKPAGGGKKSPPEARTLRFSGASSEHLADAAIVPRRRVGEGRRVSAPAVLEGRVVGRFEAGSGQASSQHRSRSRLGKNGSPDQPVDRGTLENRAATVAPLSSAAARKNIATVARKSKVGTRADPVTLYRERQDAEVRRTSAAARKRTSRREGCDRRHMDGAPTAVGYFGGGAGRGGRALQFPALR